jgi:hypothetical protein
MGCFARAVERDVAVELTINRCTDCSIPTTYVATASGELFALLMEQDEFGADREREARVESCDEIALDPATGDVVCADPIERYSCLDPFTDPRPLAEQPVSFD